MRPGDILFDTETGSLRVVVGDCPAAAWSVRVVSLWDRREAVHPKAALSTSRFITIDLERAVNLLGAVAAGDPDDMAADGVTLAMVWQKIAQEILQKKPPKVEGRPGR